VNAPDPAPAPADPTVAGPEATEPTERAEDDTDDETSSGPVVHDRDRPTARVEREIPDAPDPRTRYRRALHVGTALRSLWSSRHITWSLAWRDLRASYSQEILGFSWALIGPIMLMVVLTFLKGAAGATVNTNGVEYPVFLYIGLLPWSFFTGSVSAGANSLVNNPLLNKVYAPREVFVLAQIIESAVNTGAAAVALIALFVIYGIVPAATSWWAIPLLAILLLFTVGFAVFVAGLTVYLRDLRHALPQAIQLGFFVTPIIWSLSGISAGWQVVVCAINPNAAVIDGLRRSVLYGETPNLGLTAIAAVVSVLWLVGSFLLFKRLETGFADVS
jgi:ABC-2 type transport system permease protein/lipopolysaccharide transport system permease protein